MKKSLSQQNFTLLKYYETQRHLELHQKKIQKSKATLNFCKNKDSKQRSHRPIKKQPLAEFNRIVSINIENKALLKKLTNPPASSLGKQRPYKLIKNNRKKNFEEYKQRLQNEGLSKRISQAKSKYRMQKYASERRTTEKYVNSICKFGYKNFKPNKTLIFKHLKNSSANNTFIIDKLQPEQAFNKKSKTQDKQMKDKQNIITLEKQNNEQLTHPPIIQSLIEHQQCTSDAAGVYNISGVVWSHKVSLRIDHYDNIYNLQIPKKQFEALFSSSVQQLIEAIRFNGKLAEFYLEN